MDSVIDSVYSLRLFQGGRGRYRHQHLGRIHEHHHCRIDAPDFVERDRRPRRNASRLVHGHPRHSRPGRAGRRLAGLYSVAIPGGTRGSRAVNKKQEVIKKGPPKRVF